jgi:hypothetical protein
MVSMPTVWMIDPAGNKRGMIGYQKVAAIPRFCDVGTWLVEADLNPKHAKAAAAGWRIVIVDESGLYGGPLKRARIVQVGRKRSLVLSGEDDLLWLRDGLTWPKPTAVIGAQTDAYDVRTGVASTVIRAYVAANRGPAATDTTRRIPGLTIAADPVAGATVTGRARFTSLLELLQGLAVDGGVGFRMVPTIGGGKTFEVYVPPALAGPARFGLALGNVKSVVWELNAPAETDIIGGGRGEETARTFTKITNLIEDTAWGRREGFYDYRSASNIDGGAELSAGAARRLAEQGATQVVEVEPIDSPRLRFGIDYRLGSQVAVDVYGGVTVEAIIREVELSASRGTEKGPVRTLRPRVGDLGATLSTKQAVAMRDALARISNLERNR